MQARTRRKTVDAADTTTNTFVNPMEHGAVGSDGAMASYGAAGKRNTTPRKIAAVEMVKVDVGLQSRKAKRRSYEQRQTALKRLNKKRREAETVGENPLFRHPQFKATHSNDVSEGAPQSGVAICDYEATELDEISLREGDGWGYVFWPKNEVS